MCRGHAVPESCPIHCSRYRWGERLEPKERPVLLRPIELPAVVFAHDRPEKLVRVDRAGESSLQHHRAKDDAGAKLVEGVIESGLEKEVDAVGLQGKVEGDGAPIKPEERQAKPSAMVGPASNLPVEATGSGVRIDRRTLGTLPARGLDPEALGEERLQVLAPRRHLQANLAELLEAAPAPAHLASQFGAHTRLIRLPISPSAHVRRQEKGPRDGAEAPDVRLFLQRPRSRLIRIDGREIQATSTGREERGGQAASARLLPGQEPEGRRFRVGRGPNDGTQPSNRKDPREAVCGSNREDSQAAAPEGAPPRRGPTGSSEWGGSEFVGQSIPLFGDRFDGVNIHPHWTHDVGPRFRRTLASYLTLPLPLARTSFEEAAAATTSRMSGFGDLENLLVSKTEVTPISVSDVPLL